MGKGTGGDGGSYPPTHEQYQWMYGPGPKAEKSNPADEAANKWFFCTISNLELKEPIVVCPLGRLFNKEEILGKLVHKTIPEEFSYIKSLKDLRDVKLTPNPDFKTGGATLSYESGTLEMNGKYKFRSLPCGCVISERALSKFDRKECPNCVKPYDEEDEIVINPTEEEERVLSARLDAKREAKKKEKKKDKKNKDKGETSKGCEGEKKGEEKVGQKRQAETSSVASLSAKRAAIQAAEALEKTKQSSSSYNSLFKTADYKDKRNFISTK